MFPSSSASNTLTTEETSGFAKRVRKDNSSDKNLQENGQTMGMSEILFWYLKTWSPNMYSTSFIMFSCKSPFIYSSPLLHRKYDHPCYR